MHLCARPFSGWFVSSLVLSACVAACPGGRSDAAAPATLPSAAATLPADGDRVLRLADATSVEQLQADDTDRDLDLWQQVKVGGRGGAATVYFGSFDVLNDDAEPTNTDAVVVAKDDAGQWAAVRVTDPRVPDAGWQFVASGPGKAELWGVLDDDIHDGHGKSRSLLLAHSPDAGKTWQLSAIDKPAGHGDFDSFAMDAAGRGRATVYAERADAPGHKGGYYHYRTADGGRTWGAPEYEPDELKPADAVPDDDVPAPLRGAKSKQAGTLRIGPPHATAK